MAIFPLLATLISLACAGVIGRDAIACPRPEKITWTVAFATFAIAAGAETAAVFDVWTPFLVRLFYLTGAVLVVGYLGLGELYLLAPRRMETLRVAPGLAILITALGATLVWAAPIDRTRLGDDGWQALDRGPALVALVALCSGLGTVILVGGALWSAWSFRRRGVMRHRMRGCLLIAVGTVTVAAKGALARTGLPDDAFAIAMATGVAIIFAGYLETRRDGRRQTADGRPTMADYRQRIADSAVQPGDGGQPTAVPSSSAVGRLPSAVSADPAIAFIERRFLPLDPAALAELCRVWSCPRLEKDTFTREEAQSVWVLRLRLTPDGQDRFDNLGAGTQRQLADLYHLVLAPATADARPLVALEPRQGVRR